MSDPWTSYLTNVTGAAFASTIDSGLPEGGYNRWETSAV